MPSRDVASSAADKKRDRRPGVLAAGRAEPRQTASCWGRAMWGDVRIRPTSALHMIRPSRVVGADSLEHIHPCLPFPPWRILDSCAGWPCWWGAGIGWRALPLWPSRPRRWARGQACPPCPRQPALSPPRPISRMSTSIDFRRVCERTRRRVAPSHVVRMRLSGRRHSNFGWESKVVSFCARWPIASSRTMGPSGASVARCMPCPSRHACGCRTTLITSPTRPVP
jgi:hypothetical protein